MAQTISPVGRDSSVQTPPALVESGFFFRGFASHSYAAENFMSGSSSSTSSRDHVDDGATLPVHEYIKTLEELILRLKTDHEARRSAADSAESEPALLEEHAASINNFTTDLASLQSLQLADKQVELLIEEDNELLAISAENQRICEEVMKKRQELEEANATISKLKSSYHSYIDKKFSSNRRLDQGGKPSVENERKLQKERHKLKVLNNILLQVLTSSTIDWAKHERLVELLDEISKFL